LIDCLKERGIINLAQVFKGASLDSFGKRWMFTSELGFSGSLDFEWDAFAHSLDLSRLFLLDSMDQLV